LLTIFFKKSLFFTQNPELRNKDDTFGELVGLHLREVPDVRKDNLQLEILKLLIDAKKLH